MENNEVTVGCWGTSGGKHNEKGLKRTLMHLQAFVANLISDVPFAAAPMGAIRFTGR